MRIYTKKSFRFDHPTGAEGPVHTRALSFSDVPDWVAHSSMFKLASADESVSVIETKADEVSTEAGEVAKQRGKKAQTEAGE